MKAGTYFLFYTLAGSMPLLVVLLTLVNKGGTLSLFTIHYPPTLELITFGHKLWWVGCMLAFLVKIPLYGVHL